MRFNTDKFRSLNETISHIDQPQIPTDEYTELLESVLLALCEELELDPDVLLEDFQTPERAAEMKTKRKRSQAAQLKLKAAERIRSRKANAKIDKAEYKSEADTEKDRTEKRSDSMYGKGGKVIKSKEATKKLAARKTKETKRKAAEIKFDKKIAAGRPAYMKKRNSMRPETGGDGGGDSRERSPYWNTDSKW